MDAADSSARATARAPPYQQAATPTPRFAEPDVADVVYVEQLTSGFQLEKPAEVDTYHEVMEQLCVQAETPADSAKILQQILTDVCS